MVNKLRQKLTDAGGATLMLALLVFIMCAVVASVIMAASTASAGRMTDIAEVNQREYAVLSAAKMVKEEIENQEFEVSAVRSNTFVDNDRNFSNVAVAAPSQGASYDSSVHNTKFSIVDGDGNDVYTESGSFLAEMIVQMATVSPDSGKNGLSEFLNRGSASLNSLKESQKVSYIIKISDPSGDEYKDMREDSAVLVEITMDTNGDLTCVFTSAKEGDEDKYSVSYTAEMKQYVAADSKSLDPDNAPTSVRTLIEGTSPAQYKTTYYTPMVQTRTVKVSWDGGLIMKGDSQ